MLKRTPPNTPLQHGSEPIPASRSGKETTDDSKVTKRKKKHEDDEKSSVGNVMSEMKSMFNELVKQQTQQNEKIDTLQSALDEIRSQNTIIKTQNIEIKTQNNELQKTINFLSQKYDDAVQKIDNLQVDHNRNKEAVKKLEDRVDYLERQTRVASLEIRNIPKLTPENKATLFSIVEKIGNVVNQPVQKSEIKEVFRVRTKTESMGPVIVEFVSSSSKENFLKTIKTYNKENKSNRLNTSHLHNNGIKAPIYVSEALTAKSKRLFYLAREFIKTSEFEHCWTSNGKVYVRRREGFPSRFISSEEDLASLRREK